MTNTIITGDAARQGVIKGVNTLYDAVSCTLGPDGQNVVIPVAGDAPPIVTKDGITVAHHVNPANYAERMGVNIVRQASAQTASEAGDGTTTSVVLAKHIIDGGIEEIAKTGKTRKDIIDAIKSDANALVDNIRKKHVFRSSRQTIKHIANVSANGDTVLANVVASAVDRVGQYGDISIDYSVDGVTSVDFVDGMKIDRGMIMQCFRNDIAKDACVFDNPAIIVADVAITRGEQLHQIVSTAITQAKKPCVIIANDFDKSALDFLKLNAERGIQICAIRSPNAYSAFGKDCVDDIRMYTGATMYTSYSQLTRPNNDTQGHIALFGGADRIVITPTQTVIYGGHGDKVAIANVVSQFEEYVKNGKGTRTEKIYRERIARITNGSAIIRVGGYTVSEVSERRDRAEDAVCATRSAQRSGYCIGGGYTYYSAAMTLPENSIVRRAVVAMTDKLMSNSVRRNDAKYPFDVGVVTDLRTMTQIPADKKCPIIDPAEVIINAITNSASAACNILSVDCVVVPDAELVEDADPAIPKR